MFKKNPSLICKKTKSLFEFSKKEISLSPAAKIYVLADMHQICITPQSGETSPNGEKTKMLILLIILILVFGFGGYRMGPGLGYYGGGGLSLILTIVLILLLLKVI
jgi:hypothetical protein